MRAFKNVFNEEDVTDYTDRKCVNVRKHRINTFCKIKQNEAFNDEERGRPMTTIGKTGTAAANCWFSKIKELF